MEILRFNFCHPVNGHAVLMHLSNRFLKSRILDFNSDDDHIVEVPVNECNPGDWRVILEWQYDNRTFTHQKEFEILI